MLRYHPKHAETDSENPAAWSTCSRCGFQFNLKNMVWQYDYRGTPTPINTMILVCGRESCLDIPNPQLSPVVLSPDPPPIYNARPENYTVDETDWLVTQDDDIIDTQSGDSFIARVPNPSSDANTASLITSLSYPGGSLYGLYLDLFNGNPMAGGVSVLSAITGSSTRTDVSGDLTENSDSVAVNTDVLLIAAESASQTNLNYVAIYSASISGALLAYAPVSVNGQSVAIGTRVEFPALGLSINLS